LKILQATIPCWTVGKQGVTIRRVGSRLVRNAIGQATHVIVTTVESGNVGEVLYVLGNDAPCNEHGFRFLGIPTGAANPVTERQRKWTDPLPLDLARNGAAVNEAPPLLVAVRGRAGAAQTA
jgi:hypothetical protein